MENLLNIDPLLPGLLRQRKRNGRIEPYSRERFREPRILLVRFEEFNDARLDAFLYKCRIAFFERGVYFFNAAETGNKFGRRFLPDTRHTLDIVGRITTQTLPVRNEHRRKTK